MHIWLTVLAVAVCCFDGASAQRLTGNLTSGISCSPDAGGVLGSGCPKDEGCCPTTNTCVRINNCADYVKTCPPPTCGKDTSFGERECPAEATKVFRSAKELKCYESRDTLCSTNRTHMVVACRSAAGARGTKQALVMWAAAVMAALLLL